MAVRKFLLPSAILAVATLAAGPLLFGGDAHKGTTKAGGGCPYSACGTTAKGVTAQAETAKPQTRCPVMGGKINKALYVDADGRRVYACCAGCLPKIEADPARYIQVIESRGETVERLASAGGKTCGAAKAAGECGDACKAAKKAGHTVKAPKAAHIETPAVAVLLRSEVPFVLLDARGPKVKTWIPGATAVKTDVPKGEVARLIPSKDSLVVTYCASPSCPASSFLARHLRELGYENVLEYSEGIAGWQAAGHPVAERDQSAE